MSESVLQDIDEVQRLALASLRDCHKVREARPVRLLDEVANNVEAVAALGAAGKALAEYVASVDMSHPESSSIQDEPGWGELAAQVSKALDGGGEVTCPAPLLRKLARPCPRLLRDPIARNVARAAKVTKGLSLKSVYMLGENGFYGRPSSFRMYVRNGDDMYMSESARLQGQAKVFESNGMPELAHSIDRRIRVMEQDRAESWCGFRRLRPVDAAAVAARVVGLDWDEMDFLTVPVSFFRTRYWSDVRNRGDEEIRNDEVKRMLVMRDRRMPIAAGSSFRFQPRLYPLDKFPNPPRSVVEALATVESLPEMGGHPAFDYYWVLVPGVDINHPCFRGGDGWNVATRVEGGAAVVETFADEGQAALALDQVLVGQGYFPPVVLGERDGHCYFLSMWK